MPAAALALALLFVHGVGRAAGSGNDTNATATATATLSYSASYRLYLADAGGARIAQDTTLFADTLASLPHLSFGLERCVSDWGAPAACTQLSDISGLSAVTLRVLWRNGTLGGFAPPAVLPPPHVYDYLDRNRSADAFDTLSIALTGHSGPHVTVPGVLFNAPGQYRVSVSGDYDDGGLVHAAMLQRPGTDGLSSHQRFDVYPLPATLSVQQVAGSESVFQGGALDIVVSLDTFPLLAFLSVSSPHPSFPNTTRTVSRRDISGSGVFVSTTIALSGVFNVTVTLATSDGTPLLQSSFTVEVLASPPRALEASGLVECVARFPFRVPPTYTFFVDAAKTVAKAYRTTAVLTLVGNLPDRRYALPTGLEGSNTGGITADYVDSWAGLLGANNGTAHVVHTADAVFDARGIGVDRPGRYELQAAVSIGGRTLYATEVFYCYDPPSFVLSQGGVVVNTPAPVVLYGSLPFGDSGVVRITRGSGCVGDIATPFRYPPVPAAFSVVYNTTEQAAGVGAKDVLLPVRNTRLKARLDWVLPKRVFAYEASPHAQVCLQVSGIPGVWVPLWQRYEQVHEEPTPVVAVVAVEDVGMCAKITLVDAHAYLSASPAYRWEGVSEGRRYGCAGVPPVNGSFPPCGCSVSQICEAHIALQDGHSVDVGVCRCCARWLYALVYGAGAAVFFSTSYWILSM